MPELTDTAKEKCLIDIRIEEIENGSDFGYCNFLDHATKDLGYTPRGALARVKKRSGELSELAEKTGDPEILSRAKRVDELYKRTQATMEAEKLLKSLPATQTYDIKEFMGDWTGDYNDSISSYEKFYDMVLDGIAGTGQYKYVLAANQATKHYHALDPRKIAEAYSSYVGNAKIGPAMKSVFSGK
jgi:hypothetical protein